MRQNSLTRFWVSAERATVFADVDLESNIIDASPLVKRFIGQKFWRLVKWMSEKMGGELLVEALQYPPVDVGMDKMSHTNRE